MCFCIEFQITTHADKLQDVKNGCYRDHFIHLMSNLPGTHPGPVQTRPVLCQVTQGLCQLICYPVQLYCWPMYQQVPDVDAKSKLHQMYTMRYLIQLYCWICYIAPTVLLVAYISIIVNFMSSTVLLDKYVILLGSTVLLNTHVVSCSL